MKSIKQLLITVAMLLCSATANAHDFEVDGIFYNIISASDLTIEVTYKGDYIGNFSNEYTGDVIIPSTVTYKSKTLAVTSIGNSAFYDCTGLTSIVIGNSVTSIGGSAFNGCSGLTSIVIGNSVTSIGTSAFYDCSSLTSIEIPNSVTSIGNSAFWGCSGLTSIVIGNSVTSIGTSAFRDCTKLKTVYNFSNNLTFSKGSSNNGYVAYYADKVYNAPNGSIEGDFVFGKVNGNNTLCGYIGNDIELSLPDNYKGENYVIGGSVFYDCSSLTSIEIPNSVTSIGDRAFSGCFGLTSIEIPNSVTSIGDRAFLDCSGLTSIRLLGETPPTVGSNNFTNKQYMNMIVYVPKGTLATYQSADTWKTFGIYAKRVQQKHPIKK